MSFQAHSWDDFHESMHGLDLDSLLDASLYIASAHVEQIENGLSFTRTIPIVGESAGAEEESELIANSENDTGYDSESYSSSSSCGSEADSIATTMIDVHQARRIYIWSPQRHFVEALEKFAQDNKLARVEEILEELGIRLSEDGMQYYAYQQILCECLEDNGLVRECIKCKMQLCKKCTYSVTRNCLANEEKHCVESPPASRKLINRRLKYYCNAPNCLERANTWKTCTCKSQFFEEPDAAYPGVYCKDCATWILHEIIGDDYIQRTMPDSSIKTFYTCECGTEVDPLNAILACRFCESVCTLPTQTEVNSSIYTFPSQGVVVLKTIAGETIVDERYESGRRDLVEYHASK